MPQILSLICNETHPILDGPFLKQILSNSEYQNLIVLAPNIAIAAPLLSSDKNRVPALREQLASYPIDINILQSASPDLGPNPRKLLIADMDSTMIEQECIDELAAYVGKYDEIAAITHQAMSGELDFESALKERVLMLKGLPVSAIEDTYKNRISLTPGGYNLIQTMKKYKAYTALVSGGFTPFTKRVAQQLGFDHQEANTLLIKNNKISGDIGLPILGRQAKANALKNLCAVHNIKNTQTLAVGDGANDLDMLREANMGIAFHAKPATARAAKFQINHANLTALLYLQLIPLSEHVKNS